MYICMDSAVRSIRGMLEARGPLNGSSSNPEVVAHQKQGGTSIGL